MKTAIVILNWNGRELLEKFLPAVCECSVGEGRQVIVADNGSTDGSVEWLTTHFPQVGRIVLDRNYGFAEGYNRALEQVDAEFCLLLNSDVEVTEGWLDPLEKRMESNPAVAAAMPKLRSCHDRGQFEYAGAAGGSIDWLGYPFCRGRVLQRVEADHGQYDTPREVFWATGACLLVRTALFRDFGGFDADFFAHQEEIDLCWRWKQAGLQVWAEPVSVVYHLGGGTLANDSPRKTFLNFRNNLAMLYKNLSGRSLWPVLIFRLILDGCSAFVFLCQGKPRHFFAVWQAHRSFYYMLKSLKTKRKTVQARRVTPPSGIYRGSILWRYYTGRKISPVR